MSRAKTGGIFGAGNRGGARKGAGRPRGKVDHAKGKLQRKLLELTEKNGRSARDELLWDFQFFGEMAREKVTNGDYDAATKYAVLASEAAARAAPYMHSRMPVNVHHDHRYDLTKLNDEQLDTLEQIAVVALADGPGNPGGEDTTRH